jgi:hypothetical protein
LILAELGDSRPMRSLSFVLLLALILLGGDQAGPARVLLFESCALVSFLFSSDRFELG